NALCCDRLPRRPFGFAAAFTCRGHMTQGRIAAIQGLSAEIGRAQAMAVIHRSVAPAHRSRRLQFRKLAPVPPEGRADQ
ncbi:MAG TPA: hypothetical protein PLQ12_11800, partial [Candidatus Defluviicoccus seviourii]|nr:hypothetical protein [Candidatus Defluviicoccus seviourii]